jgi:hypothetical protein
MTQSVESRAQPLTTLERAGDLAARVGSLQPADPRIRRGLHAGIGILVALSAGLAVFAAIGDLPDVDWRFRPEATGLALLGFAACLVAHAEIWRRILHRLGPELSPRRGMAIWFTSSLGRYVPTSLLLPVLRAAMAERAGVPKRICLASVAYETALFFTAALVVGAYFVIRLPELESSPWRFLVLGLPMIAMILVQPGIFHRLADKGLARLGRERLPLSLNGASALSFAGLYAVTYVVAGLSLYALAQSVYPVGTDDLMIVIGAFAVGMVLSLLAVVLPGGLFAREAGLVIALSAVMPAGPAIAVAALARILQLGLELLGALVAPLLARGERARHAANG